jgi:hypothetical protein
VLTIETDESDLSMTIATWPQVFIDARPYIQELVIDRDGLDIRMERGEAVEVCRLWFENLDHLYTLSQIISYLHVKEHGWRRDNIY